MTVSDRDLAILKNAAEENGPLNRLIVLSVSDEVIRLRAENERLRAQLCAEDEDEPLREEIVRLRAALSEAEEAVIRADEAGNQRGRGQMRYLCKVAAVECEVRAEAERLRDSVRMAGDLAKTYAAEVERLRAELERLRGESETYDAQLEGAMSLAETAMLNPDWTSVNPQIREQVRGDLDAAIKERDALRAENERLRKALDETSKWAAAALGGPWPTRCGS